MLRWFWRLIPMSTQQRVERRGSEIAQDLRNNIAEERHRVKTHGERLRDADSWKEWNSSQSDKSE